jgi:hypothetical protein
MTKNITRVERWASKREKTLTINIIRMIYMRTQNLGFSQKTGG